MTYCELLYFTRYSSGQIRQEVLRTCSSFELIYVIDGSGRIYFDDKCQKIEQNDIVIIPPNVQFRVESDGSSEYFIAGYNNPIHHSYPQPVVFKNCGTHTVKMLLKIILSELNGKRYQRRKMLNLLFNELIILILRQDMPHDLKKNIEEDNFFFILNFLNAQSQNGISIEDAANMSGLSYHRFRHKFKEVTGISPQQYIIKRRIRFAKKLLQTTSYSTSSIAKACGFNSVPQFITCFSKQEGITPDKYRKQFKNKMLINSVKS